MKVGDIVNVYEDPWTEKKLEGKAKLIELLQKDEDREYWLVEFVTGHERHPRWIKIEPVAERFMFIFDEGLPSEDRIWVPASNEFEAGVKARDEFTKKHGTYHKTARLERYGTPQPLQTSPPEHSESEGSPPPWKRVPELVLKGICDRYGYFIKEEEKGLLEYQSFLTTLREAPRSLEPSLITLDVFQDAMRKVNRIIEEERLHIETLKRLKSTICPKSE